MRFACESCRTQYMIKDEKVGPKGLRLRCSKCGSVIVVERGAAGKSAQAEGAPGSTQQVNEGPAAAEEGWGSIALSWWRRRFRP